MYKPKLDKDIRCPLEYGLDVFGGKWNSRIICVLAAKETLRYSELRSELTNITDAVLGASLKANSSQGGIFPYGEGAVCCPHFAEHLPVVGRLSQRRHGKCHAALPEM